MRSKTLSAKDIWTRLVLLTLQFSILLGLSYTWSQTVKGETPQKRSQLSTEFHFDDNTLRGRYLYSDEAIATVENEKIRYSLLEERKDFKDRLQKASRQRR